jgi:peptide/nickel transport system permease protein
VSGWLARRFVSSLAIIFTVVTLTFFVIRLAPGEPCQGPPDRILSAAARQRALEGCGDAADPLLVQYAKYLTSLTRGYFGESYHYRLPVGELLASRIPNTLILAAAALLLDFLLGVALGVFQAMRARSPTDVALGTGTLFFASVPTFWLGMILIIVFAQWLRLFPPSLMTSPVLPSDASLLTVTLDVAWHLVLPAVTLGVVGAASTARYQRAAALDAKAHDYVRTARAKGVPEKTVMSRHVLRNALLPTVTLFGLSFPFLLTGAVLIETLFVWPGMGRLAADAILHRDYPVVSATMLVASVMVVLGSLLADILTAVVDPRVRLRDAS